MWAVTDGRRRRRTVRPVRRAREIGFILLLLKLFSLFLLALFTLKSLWALQLFIYTRRIFLWLIIWDFIIFHVLFEGFGVICGDWHKPQEKRFIYYTSSYSFHKEGEKHSNKKDGEA